MPGHTSHLPLLYLLKWVMLIFEAVISKKTQYGLKALGYLAALYGKGPVLIAEIAEQKKIPIKFLENILLLLKQNHVLESKKGKGGGYMLAAHPRKTTLATVFRIIEGPIAMLPCVSLNFYQKCQDCNETHCSLNRVMIMTRDATLKILERRTIYDLIDEPGETNEESDKPNASNTVAVVPSKPLVRKKI